MRHRPVNPQILDCHYFQAGQCRSCTDLLTPYPRQIHAKNKRVCELIDVGHWEDPFTSRPQAFRNKVKLVVTGTVGRPKLGILGDDGRGVDLRDCPLPTPGIRGAIPSIAQFITACRLEPYSPATNVGVLKYVIITESDDGELMVRFVARRRGVQGILFKRQAELRVMLPNIRVISLNVQPEHKAIIEGAEEILITETDVLPMVLDIPALAEPLTLNLRPQSFFQTNTDAATALYHNAVTWLADADNVWDLYCGVGGFALALAAARTHGHIVGVETSEQAVQAASQTAEQMGCADRVQFIAGDATAWAARAEGEMPDAVVVNPPRRGLSAELCQWLNDSGIPQVVYSSCNPETLARDIARMPEYEVTRGQVVDMFPHTKHCEVIVLLVSRTKSRPAKR
ncbi:methyltransferase domain-containing protein [Arcanobacterium buesumense]|uniref:Methyltransferase domain-containing protein n=2 Tax=Arcanobacterium buesumense TaxID=2722751 RepID=A0A6H2ENT8_9ACTO|nr:methyltransferase domain-containing protein [Arcanobacterium buesumense]